MSARSASIGPAHEGAPGIRVRMARIWSLLVPTAGVSPRRWWR